MIAECGTLQMRNGGLFRPHPCPGQKCRMQNPECRRRRPKRRALRAATGERGKRAYFKFLTVRDLISAWTGGGYGNAEGAAHGHCGSPQVEAGAPRCHRGAVQNRPIPHGRLQIGQHGTTDCGLLNAKAEGLSVHNTFFICDTDERGSGLEENLRLSSLIPAYSRLSSLNGKKMFAAPVGWKEEGSMQNAESLEIGNEFRHAKARSNFSR